MHLVNEIKCSKKYRTSYLTPPIPQHISAPFLFLFYIFNKKYILLPVTLKWTCFADCDRCCCDRASLLQRLPASSHKRCWNHLWSQCAANHQRAHSSCHCLWPGQEGEWPSEHVSPTPHPPILTHTKKQPRSLLTDQGRLGHVVFLAKVLGSFGF